MTMTHTALRWDPPGKGEWRGLHDHFPRPLTPEYQRVLAQGMEQGEAVYFERYGLPARTLQPAFVHGRVFITAASLVGPATNRVPPLPLLWLAVRLVPAFRRRARAARRALAERPWLAETEHWYTVERPVWIDGNRALEVVDVGTLDDGALIAHLHAVRDHVDAGYRAHFRLHGPDLMPTALFLTRASDWGVDPLRAAALLTGSSPASRGDTDLPDWQLMSGYDLDEKAAVELPRREAAPARAGAVDPALEAQLRASVPEADRAEWDLRLADARATYGVRDDNGVVTAAWPAGLLRRAMLEVGRRLAATGRLHDPEHAVELTVDELADVLRGSVHPSADDAAERLAVRHRLSAEAAPASLGPELALPLAALPAPTRLILRALLTLRDMGVTPPGERTPLVGVGIGEEPVIGRACVATDPSGAFARFEPGDILVTQATCPAWNALLAHAGGVVTEEGGPLSHAAVIARELGLPALVGVAGAMELVDGSRVELDPRAGTVRALD